MSSIVARIYNITSLSSNQEITKASFDDHPQSEYLLSGVTSNRSEKAMVTQLTTKPNGIVLQSSKKHLFVQESQSSKPGERRIVKQKIRKVFDRVIAKGARINVALVEANSGIDLKNLGLEQNQTNRVASLKNVTEVANLQIDTLIGVTELIKKLRSYIFQEVASGIVDRKSGGDEGHLLYPNTFLSRLLPDTSNIIKEIASVDAKISLVDSLLKENALHNVQSVLSIVHARMRLKEWKQLLHDIVKKLGSDVTDGNYQQLVKAEVDELATKPSGAKKEIPFGQRLNTLLRDKRGMKKVIGALNSTAFLEKSAYFAELLSEELVNTALVISSLRILERIDDPYNPNSEKKVDLIQARNIIRELQARAAQISPEMPTEQRNRELAKLDKELIDIIIPIANRIHEQFPHDDVVPNETLVGILDNSVAMCGGKGTICQIVYHFLNIPSISASSSLNAELIGNKHLLNFIQLFSPGKMVAVDTNYRNRPRSNNYGCDYFYNQNRISMPKKTQVYVYTVSRTPDKKHPQENSFIVFTHKSDKPAVWYSSIPYPHQVVSFDDPKVILGSEPYHSIAIATKNTQLARDSYNHALQINPNNSLLNNNYARFLERVFGDPKQIEELYKKSLISWQSDHFCVPYAKFLLRAKRYKEAEYYYVLALLDEPGCEAALKGIRDLSLTTGNQDSTQFYSTILRKGSFVYRQEMYQSLAQHYEQLGSLDISRAFRAKLRQFYDHPDVFISMNSLELEVFSHPLFGLRAKLANVAAAMNRIISTAVVKQEQTDSVVEAGTTKKYLIWNPSFIDPHHGPELMNIINSYFHRLQADSLQSLSNALVRKYISMPPAKYSVHLTEKVVDRLFQKKRDQVNIQPLTLMEKTYLSILEKETFE